MSRLFSAELDRRTKALYEPINPSSTQIRLLRLLPRRESTTELFQPGHTCTNIECTLATTPLESAPTYDALSYAWGCSSTTVEITVNGRGISIRPNLAHALAALRDSEPCLLWIDALCINQDDVHERNHQVRLMGEIYHRAKQVLVWLGAPGLSVDAAMAITERLGSCPPVSRESPPPPEPDIRHEHLFDQWIETLRNDWRIDRDWENQLSGWYEMKRNRQRRQLRSQRLPDMFNELQEAQSFLSNRELEKELQRLRGAEHRQHIKLKALESQEVHEMEKRLLSLQGQDWLRLETSNEGEFRKLKESQDCALEGKIYKWKNEQGNLFRESGNWPQFLSRQYKELHDWILDQYKELQRLQTRQEKQWAEPPYFELGVKVSLTEIELELISQERVHKQGILRNLVALQEIELQRREVEMVIEQHSKWGEDVHGTAKWMPHNEAEVRQARKELLDAECKLIEHWEQRIRRESREWEQRLLGRKDDIGSLGSVLRHLADICNSPYWGRLWIVQEILLAKDLVLHFGDNARTSRGWDVLSKARRSLDRMSAAWKFDSVVGKIIQDIKHSLPFQLDRMRECPDEGWLMHSLLEVTENSLCQDPRDKIYGLLGVAYDCQPRDIDIDYSKPLQDVYQDIIRWYHRTHRGERVKPSLVRFSQIVLLSLKGHSRPQNHSVLQAHGEVTSPSSVETFCVKAIPTGTILPIEECLDGQELMRLQQKDWISMMVEYLDNSGLQVLRSTLEEELVYLDSIIANLAMPASSSAYATTSRDDLRLGSRAWKQQPLPRSDQRRHERSQFFVAADGKFGIASTCIREDDLLCLFDDPHLGLILRWRGDRYAFVSKAIVSSISGGSRIYSPHKRGPSGLISYQAKDDQISVDLVGQEACPPSFQVVFDTVSLLQLTMPFDLGAKHKQREALCICEASFGWYEFVAFGLDADPRPGSVPPKPTGAAPVHNLMVPNEHKKTLSDRSRTTINTPEEGERPIERWTTTPKEQIMGSMEALQPRSHHITTGLTAREAPQASIGRANYRPTRRGHRLWGVMKYLIKA